MARAKFLTAARETDCGVRISKPSVGGFTLKRFPFTRCPFHQSDGRHRSRPNEQLPSDPASGCWFIDGAVGAQAAGLGSGLQPSQPGRGGLGSPGRGWSYRRPPWCVCVAAEVCRAYSELRNSQFQQEKAAWGGGRCCKVGPIKQAEIPH